MMTGHFVGEQSVQYPIRVSQHLNLDTLWKYIGRIVSITILVTLAHIPAAMKPKPPPKVICAARAPPLGPAIGAPITGVLHPTKKTSRKFIIMIRVISTVELELAVDLMLTEKFE